MRYLLLTAALAMNMQAMLAQSSYQVKNSVTLRNEDCDLTKMSVILPVPVSNIYQDVVGLKGSSGTVLDLDASNRYLRDIKTDGQPSSGESYTLSEEFSVTLYPMYIDMAQFTTLYPYDTESAIYKRYTADKGIYRYEQSDDPLRVRQALGRVRRRDLGLRSLVLRVRGGEF